MDKDAINHVQILFWPILFPLVILLLIYLMIGSFLLLFSNNFRDWIIRKTI